MDDLVEPEVRFIRILNQHTSNQHDDIAHPRMAWACDLIVIENYGSHGGQLHGGQLQRRGR
jgi:hypothetical protein